MRTSKLLITSLLAAAAMSANAFGVELSGTADGTNQVNGVSADANKIYSVAGTNNGANSVGTLSIEGDYTVKIYTQGWMNFSIDSENLTGTGTLEVVRTNTKAWSTVTTLTNASAFEGTIKIVNSGTTNHMVNLSGSAANATLNLSNEKIAARVTAENISLGGLVGVAGAKIISKSAMPAATSDIVNQVYGDTNDTTARTLTLSGSGTYDFAGTVGSTTNQSSLNLTKSGTGTQTFSGTSYFGDVTVSGGELIFSGTSATSKGTASVAGMLTTSSSGVVKVLENGVLDLSGATVSLANAIQNSGQVTLSTGTLFEVSTFGQTVSLISGTGTISGVEWNALTNRNFTYNGVVLGRSTVDVSTAGSVNISYVEAKTLTWNGSASDTWSEAVVGTEPSSKPWKDESDADDAFYAGDNVTFDAFTTGRTTNIAAGVTVTDLTISGGTHTFTVSSGSYVKITGTASVENGATLDLGTATGGTGLLRGAITVKDGGTLRFSAKDVTGYSGGDTSLKTITVESGGRLELAHSENETFAGTLNLNGTLKAAESLSGTPRFDFYGNATLNVGESTTAKITGVNIGLRRNDVIFTVGNNSTLTIDGVISNSWPNASKGNGTLTKEGSGKLVLTKAEGAATAPVSTITRFVNNGTTRVEGGATLNITGTGTNDSGSLNYGVFEIGTGSTVSFSADFKGSAWAGVDRAKTLTVEENATLNVGGILINASGLLLTNNGMITATQIDYASQNGWEKTVNNVSGSGYIVTDKFKIYNQTKFVFQNNRFVIGALEFADNGNARLGNATFGAKQDWSSDKAFALTGNAGTEATTTVFNTGVFDAGTKTFSETDGRTITLGGLLSGKGGIKKTGAGTLTLSGNNTFEGGVTLAAGTLEVGHNNALGGGMLTIQGTGTQAPELKLGTDASGNALTISNNFSPVGTVKVSSAHDGNKISGSITAFGAEIRKIGSGTLTLSGTNTGSSVFTVDITEGKIIAESDTALGATLAAEYAGFADYHKVRLSGGQLEVVSGVTLVQTNIEIVLSDAYSSTAAITGDGALAAGTTITIDVQAAAIAAESALGNDSSWTFQIATAGSTIATSLTENNFVLAEALQGTWQISGYRDGVLTLTIPEPSMFGLLAGLGALALAGTRRRRRKA